MKKHLLITILAGLFPFTALPQGPLPPPAGPPGPTMKTLDQLDTHIAQAGEKRIPISSTPFDISQPGSYYLTKDLTGAAPGITASVSGVTIDLNGFTLKGPGKGLAGTGSGIVGLNDTVVRNGRVSDFGDDGVHLGAAVFVEDLDVSNIGGACIITGEQARIRHCRAGAGARGIVVGDSSIVDSCISIGNTAVSPAAGILLGSFGTVSNSVSSYNTGDGISAVSSGTLTNCVAAHNAGNGFNTGSKCTIIGCNASSNSSSGIRTFTGDGADSSTLDHCTSTGNTGYGIYTSDGCTITACVANDTTGAGVGIRTRSNSTITRCTASHGLGDGIQFSSDCLITGNNSSKNGSGTTGIGFHSTGALNYIDSNTAMQNVAYGILIDGGVNQDVVIRNTARANLKGDYSPSSGLGIGPVADPSTATSPWANLQ